MTASFRRHLYLVLSSTVDISFLSHAVNERGFLHK
ncbi:hypothetical protein T08_8555 [Trichinella sp. T8]|nr:hypothetical protein T08_8555 [Trichinella sp. T8]